MSKPTKPQGDLFNLPKKKHIPKARSLEQTLRATADRLGGSLESSEYKHVVLSLIFLKLASDTIVGGHASLLLLTETSRWSFIQSHANQPGIATKIDSALSEIEKSNDALRGALPNGYFSRTGFDVNRLSDLILLVSEIDTTADGEQDIFGRVYEYFLLHFAVMEGKGGGEFYTPKCIVNLIVNMIEPYRGKVYDPCCGSGGMLVQSLKFIDSHKGNRKDVSIYGQELTGTTYKLAKMNLAIRGISGNLGEVPADTFFKDQHPDLKADFIMANPPFNLKAWRAGEELADDPRWAGYNVPPENNANYGWILHMISKLSEQGVAGFVLANGSMSTSSKGEGAIRQQILENDLVDCMVALPGQLFYTTQIPVCLWFLTKNKGAQVVEGHAGSNHRERRGETLFIDARRMGSMIDRTHKELTTEDLEEIARTYHAWRGEAEGYVDKPGFCKSATLEEIAVHDYVLTPGRYVGAAPLEDDGEPFDEKMKRLVGDLSVQMAEAAVLDKKICAALGGLGYEL